MAAVKFTIADIAEKQNKGYVDLTTRQDIQLHWIEMRETVGIINRLKSVGVLTLGACGDVARNVVGCPVAGVDPEEILDASPVAMALSEFFLGKPEYANLPRKYKIGIAGCRRQCIYPEIQCVSLMGTTRTVNG
ncbi:MAG: nitrite reductase, partial [Proteobacteria bacterium]|nr:nitrite reductase [Pseudomonadota bacterium]